MEYNISFQKAYNLILADFPRMTAETIPLCAAHGRILAHDYSALCDYPAFDFSSRDGFALRSEDTVNASELNPILLKKKNIVFAGDTSIKGVEKQCCCEIMTGALIPPQADAVIPWEDISQKDDESITITKPIAKGRHIRPKGIEVRKNEVFAKQGRRIEASLIGMLAACGVLNIDVVKVPHVGIVSTGNELVPLEAECIPGKVRDANAYMLAAQVMQLGADAYPIGRYPDTMDGIIEGITKALTYDIAIISGGMSKGRRDLVISALRQMGAEIKFWWVKIKPGRPFCYAVIQDKPIFCLPGTPLSAYMIFDQFVRPALGMMMGYKKIERPTIHAKIDESLDLQGDIRHFFRMNVTEKADGYHACFCGKQVPVLLKSLVCANGLMIISEDVNKINPGDTYCVELLNQGNEYE